MKIVRDNSLTCILSIYLLTLLAYKAHVVGHGEFLLRGDRQEQLSFARGKRPSYHLMHSHAWSPPTHHGLQESSREVCGSHEISPGPKRYVGFFML
jgi:hypothetical protein